MRAQDGEWRGKAAKKIALQCALQGSLAVRREAARSANAKDAA